MLRTKWKLELLIFGEYFLLFLKFVVGIAKWCGSNHLRGFAQVPNKEKY